MVSKYGKIIIGVIIGVIIGYGFDIILFLFIAFIHICGNTFVPDYCMISEEAMDEYLEEKYDENVTCQECIYDEARDRYEGKFVSNKHRGVSFTCCAYMGEQKKEYKFIDNYQANLYLSDVQSHMEDIADKYFEGEYYVVVETRGEDDESVELIPLEECINRYGQYCVYIYVYDMSNEVAYSAMEKFIGDVEEQGYNYSFYLGRNRRDDKEDYLEYIQGKAPYGRSFYVEWIYYKWLPPEERKLEPKVYKLEEVA